MLASAGTPKPPILPRFSVASEKDPTLRHFKVASGEVTQCREDAGKGVLEARRTYFHCPLGRCPDQERQRRIGKPAKTQDSQGHQRCEVSV
jgi:hypothetical protein